MTRCLAVLLFVPLLAVAAPVPKQTEKEKIEAKFGKIVDPKGDSKFALDGDALKITLPAGEERHYGFTEDARDKMVKYDHTPRVTFPHTGDFTLVVRVASPVAPNSSGVGGEKHGCAGGGVVVTPKDERGYRFGSVRTGAGEKGETHFPIESPRIWTQGFNGVRSKVLKGDTNWLRVTRTGKDLNCEASVDGKAWQQLNRYADSIDDDAVTISLYAQHGSDKSHTVTFDQFSVEKPKAEKK